MTNSAAIRKAIHITGRSIERTANMAEMTRQTLDSKLTGKTQWTVADITMLTPLLNLTEEDILDIWFRPWPETVTAGKQGNRKTVTAGNSETAMHAGKREP